jgi:hypothetical protein
MAEGIPLKCLYSHEEISQESLLALGAKWCVQGVYLPSYTIGHFVLLDALQSPYADYGESVHYNDVLDAIAIMYHGKEAVQPLFEYVNGAYAQGWIKLRQKQSELVTPQNWEATHQQLEALRQYTLAGFECIEWQENAESGVSDVGLRCDALWAAHTAGSAQKALPGVGLDAIMWEIPLVMIGHLATVTASLNGANIRRPVDLDEAMNRAQNAES